MSLELIHLSSIVRAPFVDRDGGRIGRVQDLIIRVGTATHPPVTGLVVRIGGRDVFVAIGKVASIGPRKVVFSAERVDLRKFERRPGELLLAQDLLARHLINLVRGRLITANDIELANGERGWEVVGVDPGRRPLLRRLVPGRLSDRVQPKHLVDWESIEPFVSHVPTARLRIPYRKLAKLHPAQIADLVEAASHEEGEEIIEAVGADRELEADVFEELDVEHQAEFVNSRSDVEAARLMSRMAADEAADLISQVDQERRASVLELLPELQRLKVKNLLSYHPDTAGGVMSPDFVLVSFGSTVAHGLDAIRQSHASPENLHVVFVLDEHEKVAGHVTVVDLIRSNPAANVATIVRPNTATVAVDHDLDQVARKMSDFNLTVLPVVDRETGHVLGIITIDDVIDVLLPQGWRRDFGTEEAGQP
jgi:CBS domain-containing protein